MLAETRPEPGPRFSTLEELERWVSSATDEEIVAMFESAGPLSADRAEYGKGLIEAAKSRLEVAQERELFVDAAVAD